MIILGISALYHDAAASLVINGKIIAAAQQERFSRVKHDLSFPIDAINYCLEEAGIRADEIDIVAFYDNPLYTLDRYMKNVLAAGIDSKNVIERSFDSIFSSKLWIHDRIKESMNLRADVKIVVCEHHISHAASAFFPSPFKEAVFITLDGVGEWTTTAIGVGRGTELDIKEEIRFPHSLGLLYSAFTYFCGFKVNSGDYKFMGLAPYGEPIYENVIREKLIDIKEDGSFRLNLDYFDFQYGRAMTNDKFADLFGGKRRVPESEITKREMDIAASAQKVIEDIVIRIVKHTKKTFGQQIDNLVLAGGVALNCVANGKIKDAEIFKNIWIQPAAGDAGGSLGCALYAAYQNKEVRDVDVFDSQRGSYLGVCYPSETIQKYLNENAYVYHQYKEEKLYSKIADELNNGKVIGLFHGRMEFGPRALGNRSIIADARSEEMQVRLNKKIKFRESFRPFAPSVLLEDAKEYFELDGESPYMLLVEKVCSNKRVASHVQSDLQKFNNNMLEIVKQKRSDIPAVTHVDYSARIQTVTEDRNPYYYRLLKSFKEKTGCSVIVNTSFNVRGEPIVCTPKNAYECFMRTDMDILVLEDCILYKDEQPKWKDKEDWRKLYVLD